MEHSEDHKNIIPGIREALYPGLANGSGLEDDKHSQLLRSPDPSKWLEPLLDVNEMDTSSAATEPLDVTLETPSDNLTSSSDRDNDESETEFPVDEDKSGLPLHEEKTSQVNESGLKLPEPLEESGLKTLPPVDIQPESTLSPYTQWLKSLTGSEYVHPYDDDFALPREGEDAGQGISETFAELLASQGYKDQAIAMYKRLMEKYPEKSGFFAAKIEALL